MKPLADKFGLEKVMVTTMQSLSGAGYPGVSAMDITDNVIPFIRDEEEHMQMESLKILGTLSLGKIKTANIGMSAQCNRVAVRYGHTECVSIKLSKKTDTHEIIKAFNSFNPLKSMKLPSSPEHPIVYVSEDNRPQPKLDVNAEKGMASVVGRLRACEVLDYKFVVLGHNLIRGAAGAAILTAELLKSKNYLEG